MWQGGRDPKTLASNSVKPSYLNNVADETGLELVVHVDIVIEDDVVQSGAHVEIPDDHELIHLVECHSDERVQSINRQRS